MTCFAHYFSKTSADHDDVLHSIYHYIVNTHLGCQKIMLK